MIWLHLLFSLLPLDASPLERQYSSVCSARGSYAEHLSAAVTVGVVYDVDPALLLAIAGHESCFDNTVVTGRCSGVMQTVGDPPRGILEGYARGAGELREWLGFAHGDMRVALAGYSGGVRIARQCRDGGDCSYADLFLGKARQLRSSLQRGAERAKM